MLSGTAGVVLVGVGGRRQSHPLRGRWWDWGKGTWEGPLKGRAGGCWGQVPQERALDPSGPPRTVRNRR